MELFEAADLGVTRSSDVAYRASIDDPRIDEVRILRPQEIPVYVAEGLFDIGITGRDWVAETGSDVVTLGALRYSKATSEPIKLVLAVADDSPVTSVKELPNGVRVSTEYPELTRRYFADQGIDADVRLSYGASEAKVPDIADCVVEITETGRALRAAGLRIVDTILVSHTEVIANPRSHADPDKRHAMGQLMTLLNGALDARDKVLLKLNVSADRFDAVLAVLPSAKSPTVSELAGGAGLAVESVVDKRTINLLIPALRDAGATDLLEIPISKIVRIGTLISGVVTEFDEHIGLGAITDGAGTEYPFHCAEIADGSRTIEVGADVDFDLLPKLGRIEAGSIAPHGRK